MPGLSVTGPLPPLTLTGGDGGAAAAYGGTASGYSPFTDGAMNIGYAPSLGLGIGSGTAGVIPSWVWIAAAVAAAIFCWRKK